MHACAEIVDGVESEQFDCKRAVVGPGGVVVHLAAEQPRAFFARTGRCIHATEYLLEKMERHSASISVIRTAQQLFDGSAASGYVGRHERSV